MRCLRLTLEIRTHEAQLQRELQLYLFIFSDSSSAFIVPTLAGGSTGDVLLLWGEVQSVYYSST